MSNDTVKPRMSHAELREACYFAAATATVAFALGYGYEDIAVHDDGEGWPTTMSDVDTALWPIGEKEPDCDAAYRDIATIYEAGGLASRRRRSLGSHRVSLIDDAMGRVMLDDPKIWAAIEALAAFLDGNYEGDGVYGALGANTGGKYAGLMDGEDGGGLKVLKKSGLYPTYWADEGEVAAHARLLDTIAGDDADRRAAVADLFPRLRHEGTA